MNCTEGCISESICSQNSLFLTMSILLASVCFCGGQFCYILSLQKKLAEPGLLVNEEAPPMYQSVE